MESIHDEAARLGVARPELEEYAYMQGDVTVVSLTPESDQAWAEYLRNITMAKLALKSQVEYDNM